MEEIEASDFYTELLRPRGLGWCVGTSIRAPSGDTLVFSIERAHAKGPVPRAVAESLDALRPHLARASILSARLGLDRAKSTIATLEAIGLPAAALAPTGRVVSANAPFLANESRVRIGAGNMVQFTSEPAQALLMEAISNGARSQTGFGRSVPVRATPTEPAFVEFVAAEIRTALAGMPDQTRVLFTAHSLPERILETDDPYPSQLQATAQCVSSSLDLDNWGVAWQSAGRTPEPWLRPQSFEERHGLVANVTFTSGLVSFDGRWLAYYGQSDTTIGVTICETASTTGG